MKVDLDEDERESIIELCSVGFKSCGDTLLDCDLSYDVVDVLLYKVCCFENIIRKLIEKEK